MYKNSKKYLPQKQQNYNMYIQMDLKSISIWFLRSKFLIYMLLYRYYFFKQIQFKVANTILDNLFGIFLAII